MIAAIIQGIILLEKQTLFFPAKMQIPKNIFEVLSKYRKKLFAYPNLPTISTKVKTERF